MESRVSLPKFASRLITGDSELIQHEMKREFCSQVRYFSTDGSDMGQCME